MLKDRSGSDESFMKIYFSLIFLLLDVYNVCICFYNPRLSCYIRLIEDNRSLWLYENPGKCL